MLFEAFFSMMIQFARADQPGPRVLFHITPLSIYA